MNSFDALHPKPRLLAKLASIAVHAEELMGPDSRPDFDKPALDAALSDPEVKEWIEAMTVLAMAPVKRVR